MNNLSLLLILFTLFTLSLGGFDPQSKTNLAVYWGQNSVHSHATSAAQGRLIDYCNDSDVDIFLIAFLTSITDDQGNFAPVLNLANQAQQCDVTKKPYTCPEVEADINKCQVGKRKTIILSLGGYLGFEKGFKDDEKARIAARKL